jgi:metal-responsive CopG/Arc/MetJ family transcriptional regulator
MKRNKDKPSPNVKFMTAVRLPDDLAEALKKFANRHGYCSSEAVRMIIRGYLRDERLKR